VIACFEAQTQFQVKTKHKHHWEKDKIMFNLQSRFTTTSHHQKNRVKTADARELRWLRPQHQLRGHATFNL